MYLQDQTFWVFIKASVEKKGLGVGSVLRCPGEARHVDREFRYTTRNLFLHSFKIPEENFIQKYFF